MRRVVPFFFITLILPEIIPFLILRGSSIVPSTCITPEQLEAKRAKAKIVREMISKKLGEAKVENTDLKSLNSETTRTLAKYYGIPTLRPIFMLKSALKKFHLLIGMPSI